jgi:hypothetical protein
VNGEPVTDPALPVQAGDELNIGKTEFYKLT